MNDKITQGLREAEARVLACRSHSRILGYGVAIIGDTVVPFANLVTTAGDEYYAKMSVAGVSPATPSSPTLVTGMKLGTGTTAAAKSSTGASLGTYISGSNATFDTSYPQTSAVTGTDTGWQATYQVVWAAGTATNSAIAEVVVVNDAATDATSTAANTIARAIFSPTLNKTSTRSLTVIWNHIFLGA